MGARGEPATGEVGHPSCEHSKAPSFFLFMNPTTEETPKKDTSTETCPSQKDNEWRELGPDEVICDGDEYNPASLGEWIKVPHGWIGETCDITKIRTRRPLPKLKEDK